MEISAGVLTAGPLLTPGMQKIWGGKKEPPKGTISTWRTFGPFQVAAGTKYLAIITNGKMTSLLPNDVSLSSYGNPRSGRPQSTPTAPATLRAVRQRCAKLWRARAIFRAYYNQAFVQAEYFGYLRRDPNDPPDNNWGGYDFWLTKMNQYSLPGEDVIQPADAYERVKRGEMVKAFIVSSEYRQRFGKP